ncbi:hypothetical protein KBD08_02860 [Candidatus Babeliales bacterium]|nr:hypothetical protein [Candidatus Babeliales bacterium]
MKVIKRLWCMSILLLCTHVVIASASKETDVLKLLKLLKMVDQIKKSSGGGGPSGAPSGRPISPKPPKSPRPSKRAQSPVQDSALQESIEYQQAVEESRAMAQQSKVIHKDIPSVPTSVKKPKSSVQPSKRPTADSGSAWDDEVKAIERSKQSYAEEQDFAKALKASGEMAQPKAQPKSAVISKKQPTPQSGSAWDDEVEALRRSDASYAEEQELEQALEVSRKMAQQQTQPKSTSQITQRALAKDLGFAPMAIDSRIKCKNIRMYDVPVLQQRDCKKMNWGEVFERTSILAGYNETWKFVRLQELGNCAYHALKNCMLMLDFVKDVQGVNTVQQLNRKLFDPVLYLDLLKQWLPGIYQKRLDKLSRDNRNLLVTKSDLTDVSKLSRCSDIHNYVIKKPDDEGFDQIYFGGIKTNFLFTEEASSLLNLVPSYSNDILVLDDQLCGIWAMTGPSDRVMRFKRALRDVLGIIWTEQAYPHYVSYVVVKDQQGITIYYMNSLHDVIPALELEQELGIDGIACILNMLCN